MGKSTKKAKNTTKAILTITEQSGKIELHLVRGEGDENQGEKNRAFMVGMLLTRLFHELAEEHGGNSRMEVK